MEIVNNNCGMSIKDLEYGDTFIFKDKLYMLCKDELYGKHGIEDVIKFAIDLESGVVTRGILDSMLVMKVDSKVYWSI